MSSFADTVSSPHPSTLILLRTRNGLSAFKGPTSEQSPDAVISRIQDIVDGISGIRLSPQYTPDGSLLCIIRDVGPISLFNSTTGALFGEIPCVDASYVEFSPLGSYMITWSKPVKGSADGSFEGNQRVWNVSTQQLVVSYSQKSFKKETLQFSADESLCYKCVTNEVHVLDGSDLSKGVKCRIFHKGLTQFKVSPVSSPCATVAVFNGETGGNPAKVTLYSYYPVRNESEGPISCRSMFSASEATMTWNCIGSALLVHTHSDVDRSNTSYYGTSGLFLLSSDGELSAQVPQSKDGQIHDVKWSPVGDRYDTIMQHNTTHLQLLTVKSQLLSLTMISQSLIELSVPKSLVLILSMESR